MVDQRNCPLLECLGISVPLVEHNLPGYAGIQKVPIPDFSPLERNPCLQRLTVLLQAGKQMLDGQPI